MKKPWEFQELHTKKDFQDLMLSILEPLKPYYSEGKARLQLGRTMAHYDSQDRYGVWCHFGQEMDEKQNLRKSIKKDCVQGQKKQMRSTGESVLLLTSGLWRWQRFLMA